MAKSYDISKKSDMNRLSRDLEKAVLGQAKEAANKMRYDVTCPHCQSKINVPVGKSLCPKCGKQVNLSLDFEF